MELKRFYVELETGEVYFRDEWLEVLMKRHSGTKKQANYRFVLNVLNKRFREVKREDETGAWVEV